MSNHSALLACEAHYLDPPDPPEMEEEECENCGGKGQSEADCGPNHPKVCSFCEGKGYILKEAYCDDEPNDWPE